MRERSGRLAPSVPGHSPRCFPALDGLRGVAAFCVLIFHFTAVSSPWLLPNAGLAVDFFFCMSGFILSFSYERRLQQGMSIVLFLERRLIRLFPMILAGAVIGLVGFCRIYSVDHLALAFFSGIAFLPTPLATRTEGFNAVAINPPEWSLILEFYGGLLYGFTVPLVGNRALGCVIVVSALAYEAAFWHFGPNGFGFSWPTILGGIPRFALSFAIGMAVYRLRLANVRLDSSIFGGTLFAVTSLVLVMVFATGVPDHLEWLFCSVVVMGIFPILVMIGAGITIDRFQGLYEVTGEVSYPMYILQGGIVPHVRSLPTHLGLHGLAAFSIVTAAAVVYVAGCVLVHRTVDVPFRGWLTTLARRAHVRRQAAAAHVLERARAQS